jgi:phenylacetate-CoA ligase
MVKVAALKEFYAESPVEVNPTYRELSVSPFHLVKVHKQQIARAIAEYRPRYIHGYPSAIQELLLLLGDEAGSVLEDIRCVLTVSEDMPDNFEKMVRDTLGCRVLSFYGMTERVSFIEKSASGKWIPNSCYGYTEILDGEIVGTGFTNCAMPLLRYRTGDCVDVNSEGEVVGIRGRWSHASLIGAQGNAISMTALNVHSEYAARVGPIQFVQKEKGRVEVCALESADASALKQLVLEYESKVGQGLVFIPRIVGEFKKSPVGKGILVVSELNRVSR